MCNDFEIDIYNPELLKEKMNKSGTVKTSTKLISKTKHYIPVHMH